MATIESILRETFPGEDGRFPLYTAFPRLPTTPESASPFDPPAIPFDMFAFTGRLLEQSGAYHHIVSVSRQTAANRRLDVSAKDLELIEQAAACWKSEDPTDEVAEEGKVPFCERDPVLPGFLLIYEWWYAVVRDCTIRVHVDASYNDLPPSWWRPALLLFLTSDQAAKSVGFRSLQLDRSISWFEDKAYKAFWREASSMGAKGGTSIVSSMFTFSAADPDVVCVLPKARTPSVGCTMRCLSHNLALLPPRGVAKGTWMPFVFPAARPDETHMNILLLPFPFEVRSTDFKPVITEAADGQSTGVFDIRQNWLKNATSDLLLQFISELAKEACTDVDRIHAVVLPEMALNAPLYQALADGLPQRLPGIELLVAGVSGDGNDRTGNFVSMTVFQNKEDEKSKTVFGLTCQREKHHRWRLDRGQIEAYGLQGVMSASVGWWEDIDLISRQVDFAVVRSGSVVSAMICEDLARVDPCQELIRAVGPSIIFALLMDAPQLKARWPARHATILAEDPGSAVLTLTSKGLMARQEKLGIHKGSKRVIALWRDDAQDGPVEIECADEAQGVVLSLSGTRVIDRTLDGRTDATAVSWRLAGRRELRLKDVANYVSLLKNEA